MRIMSLTVRPYRRAAHTAPSPLTTKNSFCPAASNCNFYFCTEVEGVPIDK